VSARPRQNAWILFLLLSGCHGPQSALDPAGPQAGRIRELLDLNFWICLAIYLLVFLSLVLPILFRRATVLDAKEGRVISPEVKSERTVSAIVIGALVLTAAILFCLIIVDFLTGRSLASLATQNGTNVLSIKITGQQWWWKVEYQDLTPSKSVTTANEIHVPLGTPVKFELHAQDVIHSFWIPNLHGKKDLIPGYVTTTYLQADKPGTYYGQCAEFCGYQHAHMRFVVTAEPKEQFNNWLEAQRKSAVEPDTDSEKRGLQVFLSSTCVMCHSIQGTPARATVGPDLTHLASRPMIAAASRPNARGHLAGWILDAQHIKPGAHMPRQNFSPEELQSLLDYLQHLK
jgi:cytochrome c oxidase subunit II